MIYNTKSLMAIAFVFFAALPPATRAEPVPVEFTITAGNAFFDQTPVMGAICTFNFGDVGSPYNILTGFNAAHVYRTPGNYSLHVTRIGEPDTVKIIHVLPDHRGVIKLVAGDRLSDVIRGVPDNTIVMIPPGTTWDLLGPVDIKSNNIEFRPSGPGDLPRIRRIVGNGSSTIIVHGLDITFRGIEFDSDKDMAILGNQKIGLRGITPECAHLSILDCTFRNLDDALFCVPLTRGLLIQNSHFTEETRSCDVWADGADIVLLGNTMETSQREHNVRQSHVGFYNMLVYENTMYAQHGKETLTFRIGQDLYAAHNAFHGWLRLGPGPRGDHRAITAEELRTAFVRYVVIDRNSFTDKGWVQINEGTSEATIRYNRIDVDNQGVPVRAQGPSLRDIVLEGNIRVLTAGPTQKPFFRGWGTGESDVMESGTKTMTMAEWEERKGK